MSWTIGLTISFLFCHTLGLLSIKNEARSLTVSTFLIWLIVSVYSFERKYENFWKNPSELTVLTTLIVWWLSEYYMRALMRSAIQASTASDPRRKSHTPRFCSNSLFKSHLKTAYRLAFCSEMSALVAD